MGSMLGDLMSACWVCAMPGQFISQWHKYPILTVTARPARKSPGFWRKVGPGIWPGQSWGNLTGDNCAGLFMLFSKKAIQ